MNELIDKVLQWGQNKGITGPNGTGTKTAQADKMQEEAGETWEAVWLQDDETYNDADVKDGIGDTAVTLILLAEMHGWTFEECLQAAYDVISKRNGTMVDGQFVKDN